MKHGLEEASATVRRCHIFGRGEAIWSIPVSKEVSVALILTVSRALKRLAVFAEASKAMGRWRRPKPRPSTVQELILLEVEALIDKGPIFCSCDG